MLAVEIASNGLVADSDRCMNAPTSCMNEKKVTLSYVRIVRLNVSMCNFMKRMNTWRAVNALPLVPKSKASTALMPGVWLKWCQM